MKYYFFLIYLSFVICLPQALSAQEKPVEYFNFEPGDDFKLAGYDQLTGFYKQLANSSDRVTYTKIGQSVLGKPLILLIISSKDNITNLDRYQQIAREQALAEIPQEKSQTNAQTGKAIVWLDAGLHATERATAQMMPLLTYDLATSEEKEYVKIRDEVITLIMPVMNPDGLDIVADWYNQNLGTPFETTRPPWLYHHYVGHDNNRDWFMNNMPETKAVNTILYREWFPQIVYNHHQTSPSWARMFVPPFANPVNPNIDPAIVTGTNLVGTAIANRLALKDMPGVISNYRFSMWWNGGMRTVPYYHNMIGILTETAHATPTPRSYDKKNKPSLIGGETPSDGTDIFYSDPWQGGESKFRDAVDYMYEASMAVLHLAAERKENYLSNIYTIGRRSAEEAKVAFNGYIIPINQSDPSEVIQLMNLLYTGGITIERLDEKITIDGKSYAKGSYFIPSDQSFIAYAKDLMEKQSYPVQRKYPGGPVKQPYDLAGWTLPMQMGVEFDKVGKNDDIEGIPISNPIKPTVKITGKGKHIKISAATNESYKVINYFQRAGKNVKYEPSSNNYYIEEATIPADIGWQIAIDKVRDIPDEAISIRKPKVGLYKSWVANMDEGWTRWVLTEFGFDYDTLHDQDIATKGLAEYDVIILPSQSERAMVYGHAKGFMPDKYTGGLGLKGAVALQKYLRQGGRLVAFDKAADYAISRFALPVKNITRDLSAQKFFIPGSLLGIDVNNSLYTTGMADNAVASFSRSSAFTVVSKKQEGEGGKEITVQSAGIPEHE
ncbi:MAG: M14 metallopeptidase family protein, partial [Cyclobacteriaceae bacterium]